MAKRKPEIKIVSYGLYTPFDKHSKQLPKILEFTTTVPARLGVEFGYIVRIGKARGATLSYRIEHPDFLDSKGRPAGPFVGDMMINANEYHFFLGDTFWLPLETKVGPWVLTTYLDGEQIASKRFDIVPDEEATSEKLEQSLR